MPERAADPAVLAPAGFQVAPGLTPALRREERPGCCRTSPRWLLFPGIATYEQGTGGWGPGGGTSAATPLTAAIVALVLQQEEKPGGRRSG